MKYEQFIKQVQTVAQLDTREQAERATRATLETLKERLVGNEAKDLASQLPKELAECLRGREGEDGQHFSIEEFYRRVSEKEGVESTDAAIHAKAVFKVLESAVTPGEFADVVANFSDDYQDLLAAPSSVAGS